MRWEERVIDFISKLLALVNTDSGHLVLLGMAAIVCLKYYPAALPAVGAALFMKIKS